MKRICTQLGHGALKFFSSKEMTNHILPLLDFLLLCCLAALLAACTNPFFTPSRSGTTQTSTVDFTPTSLPTTVASPTPTPIPPVINLQVISCPALSINWDHLVGTRTHTNKVQKVICGSLEGRGTLNALVNVRYYSPDAKLDYYVYDNLYGTPYRRFSMQGLLDGDAAISPSGTIITAEIGPSDSFKMVPDIFKEYHWNGTTFTQILFPGMFPDMTHYQAEKDQAVVNANAAQGLSSWKTSFYGVADNLASNIFHWGKISTSTISYKPASGIYIAQVNNLGPGGGGFIVSLFRLDNVSTNILEVNKVTALDGSTLLTSPTTGVTLTNPVSVSGSAVAVTSSKILGQVVVYDDTYVTVGNSGAIQSPASTGYVSFTRSVGYHLNARGVQEGTVAFFSTNQNNIALTNQVVMVKVFLST